MPTTRPRTTSSELRADIRRLGDLLGETLVRQEGPELLELVEKVRRLTREDGEAAAELLRGTELETAAKLVRAFSTYFHLANVTEQVHRGRELRAKRAAEGGLLARTADRLKDADPDHLRETVKNLNVRPVFTAHPTEAARRSVLNKLRRIAALLETPVIEADRRRYDTRLAENIDLVWQTDELRVVRPEPADEARNAIYYLDELHAGAVGDVLEDLTAELERVGVTLPDETRPLTFGTWIGGDRDGNPNVTPDVTWDVLILQHEHGINDALELIDELRGFLSNSIRYTGATEELLDLPPDRPGAPPGDQPPLQAAQRRGALPAQGHLHPAEAGEHQEAPGQGHPPRGRPRLPRHRRAPPRPHPDPDLAARAPRRPVRRRPHEPHDPHARRLRPPARHHGRTRTRGRPPPRARPALRPARRGVLALRRHAPRLPHQAPRQGAQVPPAAGPDPGAARRRRREDPRRLRDGQAGPGGLRARGHRVVHHLDVPGRRRRLRRRRPRPRGRSPRPARRLGEDRHRAAPGDDGRAQGRRHHPGGHALRPLLPAPRRAARRRPGGHARLLRLLEVRRHHHLASGRSTAPSGACATSPTATAYACGSSTAAAAPSAAAAAPRTTRSSRSPGARWRARSR